MVINKTSVSALSPKGSLCFHWRIVTDCRYIHLSNLEALEVSVTRHMAIHSAPSNAFSVSNSSALVSLLFISCIFCTIFLELSETEQCEKWIKWKEVFSSVQRLPRRPTEVLFSLLRNWFCRLFKDKPRQLKLLINITQKVFHSLLKKAVKLITVKAINYGMLQFL